MSKIAVFFADGVEEVEGLTVVDLCRRAGIDTVMVSIMDKKMITGSHHIQFNADIMIEDLDISSFDMLVLPGGLKGVEKLKDCDLLSKYLDQFNAEKKGLAAICAAPTVFAYRGYLDGRKACCHPSMEADMTGAEVTKDTVEISEHIICSRGLGTAIDFALAIIEKYCGKDEADLISNKIVY